MIILRHLRIKKKKLQFQREWDAFVNPETKNSRPLTHVIIESLVFIYFNAVRIIM
jgi:hypothetical protein